MSNTEDALELSEV